MIPKILEELIEKAELAGAKEEDQGNSMTDAEARRLLIMRYPWMKNEFFAELCGVAVSTVASDRRRVHQKRYYEKYERIFGEKCKYDPSIKGLPDK